MPVSGREEPVMETAESDPQEMAGVAAHAIGSARQRTVSGQRDLSRLQIVDRTDDVDLPGGIALLDYRW